MSSYEDKSPDEIERDIVATREHIDRTLDMLTERLSPSGLLDQALHTARATGGEFTLNLGRTIRDNPVPAALLGLGIGWLMVADRRQKSGRNEYGGGHALGDYRDDDDYGNRYAASDGGDGSYRRTIEEHPTTADGASDGGDGSYRRAIDSQSLPSDEAGRAKDEVKDKAQRAYTTGQAQAAAARSSLADTGQRGADKAHEAAERARAQADRARASASDTAERLRASGRDTADRVHDSSREAVNRMRESGRDTAEQVRASGRDTADRMRDMREQASERLREGRRGLSERSSEAMAHAREYRAAAGERAADMVHRSGSAVRSAGSRARDAAGSTGQFAREHPLAVGLIVAAAGAVIAGMAPRSRREDELMGEQSDELKAATRDAARAEVDRMRDAASAAMHAGSEEAKRSGLTADDAKRAADEKVAAGIGVAKAAAQAGIDKAEQRNAVPADDHSARPAEEVVGAEKADKIKPEPTAEKPANETKPAAVGGVSGIETPSVATDRH